MVRDVMDGGNTQKQQKFTIGDSPYYNSRQEDDSSKLTVETYLLQN